MHSRHSEKRFEEFSAEGQEDQIVHVGRSHLRGWTEEGLLLKALGMVQVAGSGLDWCQWWLGEEKE